MVRYASSRIGFLPLLLLGAADDDDADDGEDDAMMGRNDVREGIGLPGEKVRPSSVSCDCQNDSKKRKRPKE